MKLTHLLDTLKTCDYTCIARTKQHIYTSKDNGIRPIMMKVKEDALYFEHHILVDRIIGKAAAMLLIRSKVDFVHGILMSESADQVLTKHQIPHSYDHIITCVENRDHTGMCPMEETVKDIEDVEEAFQALTKTIARLMASS